MRKISLIFICVLLLSGCSKLEDAYQHDKDIFRMRHLVEIGGWIEEYHEKTGKYPLQGDTDIPNYVFIANEHQQDDIKGTPPYEHKVTDVGVFIDELEEGLGRKIEMKYDHQKVAVTMPNFYIYLIRGGTYFFAVHLYHDYPFARKVRDHYSKLEISNRPGPPNMWKYKDLVNDAEFNRALNEPLLR